MYSVEISRSISDNCFTENICSTNTTYIVLHNKYILHAISFFSRLNTWHAYVYLQLIGNVGTFLGL